MLVVRRLQWKLAICQLSGRVYMKRSFLLMAAVLIPVVLFAQAAKLAPELQKTAGNQRCR